MSTAFTPPGNASWQTLLDELTNAYAERLRVYLPNEEDYIYGWMHGMVPLWGPTMTFLTGARCRYEGEYFESLSEQSGNIPEVGPYWKKAAPIDVQAVGYWSKIQAAVQGIAQTFVNHISGPLNPTGTEFFLFTLEAWRSVAGLHPFGFRRATEWNPSINDWTDILTPDSMFTPEGGGGFGVMQAGDIIGPWIFEDLQKGLGAMRWNLAEWAHFLVKGPVTIAGQGESCEENRLSFANQLSAINFDDFSDSWTSTAYNTRRYTNQAYGSIWHGRQCGLQSQVFAVRAILHSVDLYVWPSGSPFFDFHNLGLPPNQYSLWESFAESADTSHSQTGFFGKDNINGFDTLNWFCPAQDRVAVCNFNPSQWLQKWNFTNA
jgi:hypothetical protein